MNGHKSDLFKANEFRYNIWFRAHNATRIDSGRLIERIMRCKVLCKIATVKQPGFFIDFAMFKKMPIFDCRETHGNGTRERKSRLRLWPGSKSVIFRLKCVILLQLRSAPFRKRSPNQFGTIKRFRFANSQSLSQYR